jgi:hypothetical protein
MRAPRARATAVAVVTGLLAATLAAAAPLARAGTSPGGCGSRAVPRVLGAERQLVTCLADLSTPGLTAAGRTNPADWAGLHAAGTVNPAGVPGMQIDGYFPDSSTFNTNNGWNHDAQFVIRLPERWNGKLVITGSPGNRGQYANDFLISDWVLARGYAFASTDKGNVGVNFYRDGAAPGDAIREWHHRVTQLTIAAKATALQRYGRLPKRTYVTGLSNGGYLARWQLEQVPWLYDGGVDWEGTLFRADGPNLLTYLPVALRNYPAYKATGDQAAHQAMIAAGFAPGSEFLWDLHYQIYWDLTQRIYREELDPGYDGDLQAGIPFCASGTPGCDADYDYANRPPQVRAAVAKVQLTGKIGRPLLTLHGTLDSLLPIGTDSDVYARLVREARRGALHRYYVVDTGNHIDLFHGLFPDRLRPISPCYRAAFEALEAWVERRDPPPASHTIPRQPADPVNTCAL